MSNQFFIPADVPRESRSEFRKNYLLLTKGTDNLFLFSADHKIEHLDSDFHGATVDVAAHDPRHLFSIADQSPVGGMATQLGLIARYGAEYPTITYVAKLNSTTNLLPHEDRDPFSKLLWTVENVVSFKRNSGLAVAGVGVTVYLGSSYESQMLEQATQTIYAAHQHGLVGLLWMYPRGKSIVDETDPELLAGAVGVAATLGADFVKIHAPHATGTSQSHLLKFIVEAAGTTKVICAGGTFKDKKTLLNTIQDQIQNGGISGAAIGRSIFQHSLEDAVALSGEISKYIYGF